MLSEEVVLSASDALFLFDSLEGLEGGMRVIFGVIALIFAEIDEVLEHRD